MNKEFSPLPLENHGSSTGALPEGRRNRKPPFNPRKYLKRLPRGDYLEVKWRLVWFRDEKPNWGIETRPLEVNPEKGYAIYQAFIYNPEGRLMATGTKMETADHFRDYVEKAETGAIGRALAVAGYGTQFAPELEEGDRVVDAPVFSAQETPLVASPRTPACGGMGARGTPAEKQIDYTSSEGIVSSPAPTQRVLCSAPGCETDLTKAQVEYSQRVFGRPLCPSCQKIQQTKMGRKAE